MSRAVALTVVDGEIVPKTSHALLAPNDAEFQLRQFRLDFTRCVDCGEPAKGWMRCTPCNSIREEA